MFRHSRISLITLITLAFSTTTLLGHGVATASTTGDLNGDGQIDHADLVILQSHMGLTHATAAQGDLNGDGVINGTDFYTLVANYITTEIPKTSIIDGVKMAQVKRNLQLPQYAVAKAAVIKAGDRHLAEPLLSVMDKSQVPPSGNKHDYMSLAPYAWPNPNTVNGLPYIIKDGQINPEFYDITDHDEFRSVATAMKDLSAAYYFTDQTQYSSKAEQIMQTWFINSATKMNPNLQYTNMTKGVNQGQFVGIIEGAVLGQILDAVEILQLSPNWTASDQAGFTAWCTNYYKWLTTSGPGIEESKQPQNLGTWYQVQAGTLAEFLGNHAGAQQAVTKAKSLINGQITSAGHQSLELARTRPWNYSTLNLEGLIALAQIGERENIHLWNYVAPSGGSIRKAIDYLAPYAKDPKTWPYAKDLDPWRPYLMAIPLRQAASFYNSPTYTQEANNSVAENPQSDWTSLLY